MNLESLNLLAMKMGPITRNKLSPGGLDSGNLSFLVTTCVLLYHKHPQTSKGLDSSVGGVLARHAESSGCLTPAQGDISFIR